MVDNDMPEEWPVSTPVAVDRIYKEEYYTLLHIKYESSWPCGFGEEDLFMFFQLLSLWELLTPPPPFPGWGHF